MVKIPHPSGMKFTSISSYAFRLIFHQIEVVAVIRLAQRRVRDRGFKCQHLMLWNRRINHLVVRLVRVAHRTELAFHAIVACHAKSVGSERIDAESAVATRLQLGPITR